MSIVKHCENHKTCIIIFTRKDTLHGYCVPHLGPVRSILHTYVLMKLSYQTDTNTMYYVTFSATIFSSVLSILQFWHCSVHTDSSYMIINCNTQRKKHGVFSNQMTLQRSILLKQLTVDHLTKKFSEVSGTRRSPHDFHDIPFSLTLEWWTERMYVHCWTPVSVNYRWGKQREPLLVKLIYKMCKELSWLKF